MIVKPIQLPLLLLMLSAFAFAGGSSDLSGDEIRSLVGGKTANCLKTRDGSTCDTYFGANGEIKRFTPKNGKRRTGTWSASEADGLCVHWTGKKKQVCFVVTHQADGYHLMRKGKHKATMTAFADGNTLGW